MKFVIALVVLVVVLGCSDARRVDNGDAVAPDCNAIYCPVNNPSYNCTIINSQSSPACQCTRPGSICVFVCSQCCQFIPTDGDTCPGYCYC
ncbi:hypothetical protein NPIL_327751 [Nephila pilipes]|uniref:Spider venom protein n=1 Tax=Nephila pilipes TaxID=299642 RepID=A0A8X6QU97_NEPPI|nr:hypothetical protein NPIL_327751 [Nephila pilipes]